MGKGKIATWRFISSIVILSPMETLKCIERISVRTFLSMLIEFLLVTFAIVKRQSLALDRCFRNTLIVLMGVTIVVMPVIHIS